MIRFTADTRGRVLLELDGIVYPLSLKVAKAAFGELGNAVSMAHHFQPEPEEYRAIAPAEPSRVP